MSLRYRHLANRIELIQNSILVIAFELQVILDHFASFWLASYDQCIVMLYSGYRENTKPFEPWALYGLVSQNIEVDSSIAHREADAFQPPED